LKGKVGGGAGAMVNKETAGSFKKAYGVKGQGWMFEIGIRVLLKKWIIRIFREDP